MLAQGKQPENNAFLVCDFCILMFKVWFFFLNLCKGAEELLWRDAFYSRCFWMGRDNFEVVLIYFEYVRFLFFNIKLI